MIDQMDNDSKGFLYWLMVILGLIAAVVVAWILFKALPIIVDGLIPGDAPWRTKLRSLIGKIYDRTKDLLGMAIAAIKNRFTKK